MSSQDKDDVISNATRAMAQHAVVAALVRLHPEPQKLRDLVEQFAEAHRAHLLASDWTDVQVQQFDRSLAVLTNTLPPVSAK
jgi:hypothetical protein